VNCSDPDKLFEQFISAHPQYKINIVYFHNLISTSYDPFYTASDSGVNPRMNLYGVIGDPDMFISGFSAGTGQMESHWEQVAANPISAQYLGTLSASASINGDGKINITLHASAPSTSIQVKPYVMLVESGIQYTNTTVPGYTNPDGTTWDNVYRAMIPSKTGGASFMWDAAQDFNYTYDPLGKPWNLNNCKIYAFLQEVTAQSDKISYAIDAFAVAPITKSAVKNNGVLQSMSLDLPVPNPAQSFTRIPFHLAHPANVKISISDDLGREVGMVLNKFVSETESSVVFTPNKISSGIYYARMYADGVYIGMQKIVFAP
jgi:hypothetical protein